MLKRRRSTPVPAWVLIASRTLTAAILAIVLVVVIVAIGRIAYGVHLPSSTIPAFVLGVVVGAACFLLSVVRGRELHPQRGLRPADRPGDRSCRCTSSPASSSRRISCPARSKTSPACSRSAISTTRCSRRSTRPPPAPGSPGRPPDPRHLGCRRAAHRAVALLMVPTSRLARSLASTQERTDMATHSMSSYRCARRPPRRKLMPRSP